MPFHLCHDIAVLVATSHLNSHNQLTTITFISCTATVACHVAMDTFVETLPCLPHQWESGFLPYFSSPDQAKLDVALNPTFPPCSRKDGWKWMSSTNVWCAPNAQAQRTLTDTISFYIYHAYTPYKYYSFLHYIKLAFSCLDLNGWNLKSKW